MRPKLQQHQIDFAERERLAVIKPEGFVSPEYKYVETPASLIPQSDDPSEAKTDAAIKKCGGKFATWKHYKTKMKRELIEDRKTHVVVLTEPPISE